jgi:uncharacterized metal-binding protein
MKAPKCAKCKEKPCNEGIGQETVLPIYCPIKNFKDLIKPVAAEYRLKEIQPFFLSAALTEKEGYDEKAARQEGRIIPVRPRIREVAEFAKKVKAKKIGLAFCIGLADEANRASIILESHGLEIISIVCSCGSLDKTEVGIPLEYKIKNPDNFEAACNPLLQAEVLNRLDTSFNILVGLCVGHDMLFTQHSKSPVTTLIVKDRLTGHNPVISLYTRYHRHIR